MRHLLLASAAVTLLACGGAASGPTGPSAATGPLPGGGYRVALADIGLTDDTRLAALVDHASGQQLWLWLDDFERLAEVTLSEGPPPAARTHRVEAGPWGAIVAGLPQGMAPELVSARVVESPEGDRFLVSNVRVGVDESALLSRDGAAWLGLHGALIHKLPPGGGAPTLEAWVPGFHASDAATLGGELHWLGFATTWRERCTVRVPCTSHALAVPDAVLADQPQGQIAAADPQAARLTEVQSQQALVAGSIELSKDRFARLQDGVSPTSGTGKKVTEFNRSQGARAFELVQLGSHLWVWTHQLLSAAPGCEGPAYRTQVRRWKGPSDVAEPDDVLTSCGAPTLRCERERCVVSGPAIATPGASGRVVVEAVPGSHKLAVRAAPVGQTDAGSALSSAGRCHSVAGGLLTSEPCR